MKEIPIYIIHDPLRKDRKELLDKELVLQGITDYELIPAVKKHPKAFLNIAEAHKNCIKLANKAGYEQVVVMEDDVMFVAPGAYNRFLELSELLPDNWDLFSTGSYDWKKFGEPKNGSIRALQLSGRHCYMVHERFYKRYLDIIVTSPMDKLLKGHMYMAYPMLALQHDTFSDHVKKVTNYNKIFAKSLKLWNGKSINHGLLDRRNESDSD